MDQVTPDDVSHKDSSLLDRAFFKTSERPFRNVYPYITEQCQLRCEHCYLGENRLSRASTMSLTQVQMNLLAWRELGGKKVCFLGGEPTLHSDLEVIVGYARELGYEQIIIDTNGLTASLEKLRNFSYGDLSYIQVSLDGATAKTHDFMRGKGTFKITINSIKQLCEKGFDVRLICTVNKTNRSDCLRILDIADGLGVSLVKYHIFSGIGMGQTNADLVLDPYEWLDFINTLSSTQGKYRCKILYQPTYAREDQARKYVKEGYNGCIGRKFDRVSIFPDGKAYICSYLFDTNLNFADVLDGNILQRSDFNEIDLYDSRDIDCIECERNAICMGGCPAEIIVTGVLPCRSFPGIVPICRLWKSSF